MEAGGIRGERQPQCYYPYPLPHPHLQGSIRDSSLIHLSGELVRGRAGGGEMLSPGSIQGDSPLSPLPSRSPIDVQPGRTEP